MLKINLIKKTTGKKKSGTAKSGKLIVSSITVIVVLLVIGVFLYRSIFNAANNKKTVVTETISSDYKASSHSAANVIEDVVKEINSDKAGTAGFLEILYKDMAFNERINYEVLYLKNILEMLTRTFPDGIGLKKLDISKFQTVYAVGLGDTKDIISQTFNSLRKERVEILPKPYSFITANGKGYRFNVTLKTEFGLDYSDRFQAIDHLVHKEYLGDQMKKIVNVAKRDNLKLVEEPVQLSVENVGGYRRYIYKTKAECSYRNFVRFVMDLNKEQIPCAFKEVIINAQAGSVISVDAEILITVKNI